MKQAILILILALTFTSCLKEGNDGCPDYISLSFQSTKSGKTYDEVIGNDVHLRIYKDNVLHSAGIIPYEEIKGGKECRIRKEVTGDMDIIAWAIPAGEEFVGEIPEPAEDNSKRGEMLVMQANSRSESDTYSSMGHLYLGTFNYYDTDISEAVRVDLPMQSCICQFTATLQGNPDIYTSGQEEKVWFEIYGTKSGMDLDFNPQGGDAIIPVDLHEYEDGILRTDMHGLLPSEDEQYISVKAYKGETHVFTVYTEYQSRPGDIIHIDVFSKSVTVYVNDWRIIDAPVDWI
ncbi:MAG: FimB/Mfa2 family fimbrial subunit [Tannerellaceae bacterium]|nr:FimB/Mfa2 family fimbrial subunit [Tannerellaceae bacterium]